VTRVVELLQALKTRLASDEATEQAKYDKFACWCEDTTAKKAQDITAARSTLKSLGIKILELKGLIATREAEIKELAADIRENEAAQESAKAIRSKENAAYIAERTEMEQAINALERAITVLKGATTAPASLRQTRADIEKWSMALAALRETIGRLPPKTAPDAKHVAMLTQLGSGYTPQSATVQGILSDMYSSFSETLQRLSSDEATKHRSHEDLMATYHKELATLQETIVKKETEKVEAESNLADTEVQFADLEKQLAADVAYFDATKASCVAKTDEWTERKALRAEEVAGIEKALEILTSDEAKKLFSKAITPGVGLPNLLQVTSTDRDARLARAQQTLRSHARAAQSLRLAALASEVASAGHFEEVIKVIDGMISQLAAEEQKDQEKVDACKDNYQKLDSAEKDTEWKLNTTMAKMDKLEALIEQRVSEKAEVASQLAEVVESIASLKGNRTEDNTAYLQAKSDDEKAVGLLQQAQAALEEYYAKNGVEVGPLGNGLLQRGARRAEPEIAYENEPPETKFSDKGHRKVETKGAISSIANIIEDLQSELSDAKKGEEDAQVDFEKQLAAAEALQEELTEREVSLEQTIANRRSDLQDETGRKTGHESDRDALAKTRSDITPGCDFYIKNQAERRRQRGLEMDGLKQAKDYLAGYRPPSMLQQRRAAPKPRGLGLERITFAHVA